MTYYEKFKELGNARQHVAVFYPWNWDAPVSFEHSKQLVFDLKFIFIE